MQEQQRAILKDGNRTTQTTKWLCVVLLSACAAQSPIVNRDTTDQDSAIPVTRYTSPSGQSAGVILQIPAQSTDPQQAADIFLGEYGHAVGIDDPASELRFRETQTHGSLETVVYEATQDGHPVYGAEVRVIIVDGNVVYAGGSRTTDHTSLGEPAFSQAEASALFLANERAEIGPGEVQAAWEVGEGRLVAFNLGVLIGHSTRSALAWQLEAVKGAEIWHVFVDAVSGVEIIRLPRFGASTTTTRSFADLSAGEIEALSRDEYNDNSVITHRNGEQVDDVPITADAENATRYLHTGLDYFERAHGRDGWDDACGHIDLYVDMEGLNNAYWSGGRILFDPQYLAEDVMIHELTHGVIAATANLHYSFESGALNESLADFFAEAALADGRWALGEDLDSGALRSFSDPALHGQPVHYRERRGIGSFDDCAGDADCPHPDEHCITSICIDDRADHGGVHGNSGIINHALYLLSEGGRASASGVQVEGIGSEKAADLVYLVLGGVLGPNSTFEDFRMAMHLGARFSNIFGFGDFSTEDCGSVLNAFAAVGIGSPDGDNDCVADDVDNCPCIANQNQNEDTCATVTCDTGCYLHRDCGSCGGDDGCGWCDGQCQELDEQQMCTRRSFEVCPVDPCTANADCRSCGGASGCGWCEGSCQATTSECVSATGASVPFADARLCIVEECSAVSTCRDCNATSACAWCDGSCQFNNGSFECEAPTTVCPFEVDCRPGTDCATCTAIPGCGWGADGCDIVGSPAVSSDPRECGDDVCGFAADCLECTATPGCGWAGSSCRTAAPGTDGVTTRAAECFDCSGISDCETCAENGFCEWCGSCGNTYQDMCENPTPVLDC